jgi:hypothetical protein
MSVETNMDTAGDITEHVVTGRANEEEFFEAEQRFYREGPTLYQLWDLTGCDLSGITISGLRSFVALAARLGQVRPEGRTAIVVESDLQFGLARMSEAFGDLVSLPFALRVFKDRGEALAWLRGG